jgi:hypothetical protein
MTDTKVQDLWMLKEKNGVCAKLLIAICISTNFNLLLY